MYYTLTCTAYTFTCTTHICLLYKGTHVYSLIIKYNITNFSISNIVSEPLLWPFLSSLVFIGVTPFSTSLLLSQQSPQPLAVEPPTSSSRCLWVSDLQLLSLRSPTPHRPLHVSSHRREYFSNHISSGIIEIIFRWSTSWWKPRNHRRPHAPLRTTQSFYIKAHVPHALSLAPADVTCDVISATSALAYVSIQSVADVSATSSCWPHPLTVDQVDFDYWPLTLIGSLTLTVNFSPPEVDFCSPGSPYPIFHVDFIFAYYISKWLKMIFFFLVLSILYWKGIRIT